MVVESQTLHLMHIGTECGAAAHTTGSSSSNVGSSGNGSGRSGRDSSCSGGGSCSGSSRGITAIVTPAARPPDSNGSVAAVSLSKPCKPLCQNSLPDVSEAFNAAAAPAEQMAFPEQLQAALNAPPAERMRHLALPQWQLQALGDAQRAAAYEAALMYGLVYIGRG